MFGIKNCENYTMIIFHTYIGLSENALAIEKLLHYEAKNETIIFDLYTVVGNSNRYFSCKFDRFSGKLLLNRIFSISETDELKRHSDEYFYENYEKLENSIGNIEEYSNNM